MRKKLIFFVRSEEERLKMLHEEEEARKRKAASVINGVGDVVLCNFLGYGIAGAAWATMVSQIEKHELLEMRHVAAYIYKKAGRWKQSIALSKKDNHYKDAMETTSQSGDRELAEELLVYFIE